MTLVSLLSDRHKRRSDNYLYSGTTGRALCRCFIKWWRTDGVISLRSEKGRFVHRRCKIYNDLWI